MVNLIMTDIEIVIKFLYENNIPANEIAKILNTYPKKVLDVLRKLNIPIKKPFLYYKKYELNESYFEKIDTKDKAYFLGLLMADGYNNKEGFVLSLQEKDSYILEVFKNKIEYSGIIKIEKRSELNSRHKNIVKLCIYSKKISNDLNSHGCIPNKSKNINFPDIAEEFYSHFIRGVFDGDGHIRLRNKNSDSVFSIVGFEDFLEKIQTILIDNCDLNKTKLSKTHSSKIIRLTYCGRKSCSKIYKYLYQNCEDLYLKRKKEKFEEIYYLYNKYK